MNASQLRARFAEARAQGKRAKDAAETIGASEGAVIAAHMGDHDQPLKAVALHRPWLEVLQALNACGPVMALTRNETTVHEKTGVYENLSATGPVGLALGEDIDLRLFFMHWHAGFAVTETAAQASVAPALSLQFFDANGLSVHKVFCRDVSNRPAFEAVMRQFADPALEPMFSAKAPVAAPATAGPADADAFLAAWAAMQDTHEFFDLLRRFGVERQQGFALAEGRFTRRVATETVRRLLQEAAFDGTPIMVFVGSPGCIQIHTGPVVRVEPMSLGGVEWLNVLDPTFSLHMKEGAITDAWVVEKPTSDGVVTSLELFDGCGAQMAMLFGERKPGKPEREDWRALVRKSAPALVGA